MESTCIIYTAIYGGRDTLREVPPAIYEQSCEEGIEWACFTDDPTIKSETWDIVCLRSTHDDPVMQARSHKLPVGEIWPSFSRSIWMDARAEIRNLPWRMFDNITHDFAVACHNSRDCVYDEIIACVQQGKDSPERLELALDTLYDFQHPVRYGLWMTGLLFRRHTPDCLRFCDLWWKSTQLYTRRDQVTLPLVLRQSDFTITTLSQEQLKWCVHFGKHAKQTEPA